MKTYKGIYRVKNRNKYRGDVDNVVYRSGWEKSTFLWCDNEPSVKEWSSEEIVIPYLYEVDRRYHRYFPDLIIKFTSGKTILVEIKPFKETSPPTGNRRTKQYISEGLTYVKNMNKWEAANEYCKDRGWEFQVWTEKELQKMGILKQLKPMKKMKPLKPFKPKKKTTK